MKEEISPQKNKAVEDQKEIMESCQPEINLRIALWVSNLPVNTLFTSDILIL